ncbi:hypothetical protein K439DRAFT_1624260 [Ramaria rubella]|nr:hypothetical protein K439DRAFT_1624260 [Ramaria rubella]
MIQEGLVNILTKRRIAEKVTMNYERKIVEERGVVLKGWLGEKVVNPGKLGAHQHIWELLEDLKNKECRWVTLTNCELEDHIAANKAREAAGEQVYKQRKKALAVNCSAVSADMVDDNDDDED